MPFAPPPDFSFENEAAHRGAIRVAGIDEAGRGPLAGPVVAAAVVIVDRDEDWSGLTDSKLLSETERDAWFDRIVADAHVAIASTGAATIDRLNIRNATHDAMRRAVAALPVPADHALVDGNALPDLPCRGEAVVKGDRRSLSIAAASVVAKVTRDRVMRRLDGVAPGYGFAKHKGYGTKAHRDAIARLGPSPFHRMTFAPMRGPR